MPYPCGIFAVLVGRICRTLWRIHRIPCASPEDHNPVPDMLAVRDEDDTADSPLGLESLPDPLGLVARGLAIREQPPASPAISALPGQQWSLSQAHDSSTIRYTLSASVRERSIRNGPETMTKDSPVSNLCTFSSA